LGISTEALFFVSVMLFNRFTGADPDQSVLNGLWSAFHWPAATLTDFCRTIILLHGFWGDMFGLVTFFLIALFQWWTVFFLAIKSIPHGRKSI
jgi:hypothetical protein